MAESPKEQRSCVITPDAIGPVTNGGIGTHCTNLARLLANSPGSQVTLLFTGTVERETAEHWAKFYQEKYGVEFVSSEAFPDPFGATVHAASWALARSRKIYEWLKGRRFGTLYFQDWHANGFIPLQAKRTGRAFQDTLITCTFHSPSQWQRQGMHQLPNSRSDLVLDFMERYVLEHADVVLSPSEHMFRWAEANGLRIAQDHRILPYPFYSPAEPVEPGAFDGKTLIFFGRLETRKGIEVFLDALAELAPDLRANQRKLRIHFLGKIAPTLRGLSPKAIEESLAAFADVFDWELHTEMSQPEAVQFLVEHREALIVTPSLLDNLPFAIIECLELRLNILAAATGGIPELFADDSALFAPNARGLAEKLRAALAGGFTRGEVAYSSVTAREQWARFGETVTVTKPVIEGPLPRISVCIPHYNYGHHLPRLLDSLEKQIYKDFEVVAVDDGSTEQESRKVFAELGEQYRDRGWRFFQRENVGVGNARNFAVSQARGECIVFMDPDNVAMPEMLQVFAESIRHSGADCLTCHLLAFGSDEELAAGKMRHCILPAGACLEEGLNSNIFGDTNLIVRKSAFEALGGFREVAGVTNEDWEFLARLCLKGYRLEVVPEFLFRYRAHDASRTAGTHRYRNIDYVLDAYAEELPDWANRYIAASLGIAERINDPDIRKREQRMKEKVERLRDEKNRYKQQLQEIRERRQKRKLHYRIRHLFGKSEQ